MDRILGKRAGFDKGKHPQQVTLTPKTRQVIAKI
jgi:hypothetical protein